MRHLCELGERPGLQRGDVVGRCMRTLWDAALGCPAQWGWISPCSAAPCQGLPLAGTLQSTSHAVCPQPAHGQPGAAHPGGFLCSALAWPSVLERAWARSLEPPGPALRRQRCPSSAHGLSLLQPRHCHPQGCARPREHSGPAATRGAGGQRGSGTGAALATPSAAAAGHSCCASTDLPQLCTQTLLLQLQRREQEGQLRRKICWERDPLFCLTKLRVQLLIGTVCGHSEEGDKEYYKCQKQ